MFKTPSLPKVPRPAYAPTNAAARQSLINAFNKPMAAINSLRPAYGPASVQRRSLIGGAV